MSEMNLSQTVLKYGKSAPQVRPLRRIEDRASYDMYRRKNGSINAWWVGPIDRAVIMESDIAMAMQEEVIKVCRTPRSYPATSFAYMRKDAPFTAKIREWVWLHIELLRAYGSSKKQDFA